MAAWASLRGEFKDFQPRLRWPSNIGLWTPVNPLRYRSASRPGDQHGGGVDDELVSGAEIGRRLGVSRERVRQWASDPKYRFPDTLGRVGGAKIWKWPEIQRWAEARRVDGRVSELKLGHGAATGPRPMGPLVETDEENEDGR